MKKIIVFVITTALCAGLLSGCGQTAKAPATGKVSEQPTTAAGNAGAATQGSTGGNTTVSTGGNTSASTGSSSKAIYKEPGSELGDFAASFTDSEESFSKIIDSSLENNMDTLDAKMSIGVANMPLATLSLYDALSPLGDQPKKEGKLVLSGFDAVREKSGNAIKFSASHEYDKNINQYKKGDKCSEQGLLDMSANTLKYEEKTERDGKVIARTVLEAVILQDGTHLLQYLSFAPSSREGVPPTQIAVFKRFNKDEYTNFSGHFNGNADFSYNSIIGKGDIQPEAMAQNCQITGKISVAGGKASFTK